MAATQPLISISKTDVEGIKCPSRERTTVSKLFLYLAGAAGLRMCAIAEFR